MILDARFRIEVLGVVTVSVGIDNSNSRGQVYPNCRIDLPQTLCNIERVHRDLSRSN